MDCPAVSTPNDPTATRALIVEHLRAGGATDLRSAHDRVWIVGRAPSGALFELYEWPEHGYYVARRPSADKSAVVLGVFAAWNIAADCALHT
jgi:hypothetical protein